MPGGRSSILSEDQCRFDRRLTKKTGPDKLCFSAAPRDRSLPHDNAPQRSWLLDRSRGGRVSERYPAMAFRPLSVSVGSFASA
jgi:hypothetical protein